MKKSIITEYETISTFSGKPNVVIHHTIFGNGLRELADKYLLTIFVTPEEHNCSPYGKICQIHDNPAAETLSKMLGQVAFEKEYYRQKCGVDGDPAREEFRRIFGISYL